MPQDKNVDSTNATRLAQSAICRAILAIATGLMPGGCGDFPAIDESPWLADEPTIVAALDAHIDTGLASGNAFDVIVPGRTARGAIESLIDSADVQIHIETLLIDADGPIGDTGENSRIVEKLCAKASAGIPVRLIIDAMGQRMFSDMDALQPLRAAGVDIRVFTAMPDGASADDLLYRSHKKLLIVDGRTAILGGRNLSPKYFDDAHHRDTTLRIAGPSVNDFQRQFLADWADVGEPLSQADAAASLPTVPSAGSATVRTIDQRPTHNDFDISNAVKAAIALAHHRIRIQTPYWNPTPALRDALIDAASRGVLTEVMTNGPDATDKANSYAASASTFAQFLAAGVRIHLWNAPGRFLHSKAMVVDDAFAMIGSYNFNFRSTLWDAEDAAILTDPAAVAEVSAMLDNDWADDGVFAIDTAWLADQLADTVDFWAFARTFAWVY